MAVKYLAGDRLIGTAAERAALTTGDTLGSDGNATNTGTAALDTTNQKLGTGCLDFESGESDYINATNLLTNNAMTTTGTIAFWVKPESLNGAKMWTVSSTGSTSGRMYLEQQSTTVWTVFAQQSGSSQWKVDSTGVTFSTGTWYHVAITHDGGSSYGAVKLYIDGVDRSSNSNNGTTWTKWISTIGSINDMAFGRSNYNSSTGAYYDGLMDDIGIWNRALSSSEVAALYNSGTGALASTITSGLRAYYNCDSATTNNNAEFTYPNLTNGAIFEESDTGKHYMFDGTSAWNEIT
tara:strand:+ start:1598 stop:2479 length:882 start_codon:yes stop_codon:yes gene_type:complete